MAGRATRGGLALAAALAVALAVAGCKPDLAAVEAAEQGRPLLEAARGKEAAGDIEGAVQHYRAALDLEPRNGRAHLDLALLLHQQRQDYVGALYHYGRYLELRPTAEKDELVRDRIRLARQLLLGRAPADDPEAARELVTLRRESTELASQVQALQARVRDLTQQLAEAQARPVLRVVPAPPAPVPPVAGRSGGEPNPVVAPPAVGPAPAGPVRQYRVRPGDSLISIAKAMYQDGDQWEKIFKANREKLAGANRLGVGQVLAIPP